ncbi:MAG: patatin-like phospholipase family protein [Hyphomicrobiaceae bacterium]
MLERRRFCQALIAGGGMTVLQPSQQARAIRQAGPMSDQKLNDKTIALALGGGAAKGIAHIPVLEGFDELGVRPTVIAGTSIGAIIGACYASGMSGKEIRTYTLELFESRRELLRRLFSGNASSWLSIFSLSSSAIISPERLLDVVLPDNVPETFEDLPIPLHIVATDFRSQSQVVLEHGKLLPAIGASAALPALLSPIELDGRLLIDGGFVNPTPFDVLTDLAQFTVAVDVTGFIIEPGQDQPGTVDALVGATQIALQTIVKEKIKCAHPDLLLRPKVQNFQSMDFYSTVEILEAAEPMKEALKRGIGDLLDARDL